MHNRITFGKRRMLAAALLTMVALGVMAARWTSLPASAGGPAPLGAVASKILAPGAAPAVQGGLPLLPWTAVAATGIVDEDSLQDFGFDDAWATYRSGSQSLNPLTFRYNVTNPGHDTPIPGWMRLFLNSHVPAAGGVVRATLIRVDPCTGERTPLCTTVNNQVTESPICTTCEFAPADINFQQYLYYVRVQLDRADQPDPPRAYSVHLRP
jgi:uncharacterized membrane protein